MNKKTIIAIIFSITLIILNIIDTTNRTNNIDNQDIISNFSVFFCQIDDCPNIISEILKQSSEKIYCAFYDLNNKIIINSLINISNNSIKLILEKGNFPKKDEDNNFFKLLKNIEYKNDTNKFYMHNKFCIIDDETTITGSMNPTLGDSYNNDNNLIIIKNKEIKDIYYSEFIEMWQGTFGKGEKTNQKIISFNTEKYDTVKLKPFFCPDDPCSEIVSHTLELANESIYFMTFSFTDDLISNMIVKKSKDNVTIKGIIDTQQSNVLNSKYDFLKYHDINISKDKNKYMMHHKIFIIDKKIVITGSMNPTESGTTRNDENFIIIENKKIADEFIDEFYRILNIS